MRNAFRRLPVSAKNIITAGVTLLAVLIFYFSTNQLTGGRQGITLVTPVDAVIPFIPAAIFGILLFLPLFFLPFLIVTDRILLGRIAWGIIICITLVIFVYLALPTRVPRPGIPTQENFLYWLVAFLYVIDNPVNCLPGLSLTISIFITYSLWPLGRLAGWASLAATTIIAISSLLLRQHYLADVLASLILAYLVYRVLVRAAAGNTRSIQIAVDFKDWQRLAQHLAYSYIGPIVAGWILFEIGLRFNPVLPTN
jgi:hypothetical protein